MLDADMKPSIREDLAYRSLLTRFAAHVRYADHNERSAFAVSVTSPFVTGEELTLIDDMVRRSGLSDPKYLIDSLDQKPKSPQ